MRLGNPTEVLIFSLSVYCKVRSWIETHIVYDDRRQSKILGLFFCQVIVIRTDWNLRTGVVF